MDQPFSPQSRLDVGHEDIRDSGFWQVSHVPDPSFIVATRPEPQVVTS